MMVPFGAINTVNGPLVTVKLKNGGAAGGGLWVVFKLAELDATEDVTEDVEVALEDAAALDSEVELVAEVLGVVVAVVALVVLVVEDFCAPFGTENPTTPPMTTTTMTITANAVVLRPGRPFLGDTILPPRPTAMSLLTVPSARQRLGWTVSREPSNG